MRSNDYSASEFPSARRAGRARLPERLMDPPADTLLHYALKGLRDPYGGDWLIDLLDQLIGREGWRRLRDGAAEALEREATDWDDRIRLGDTARRAFDRKDPQFRARVMVNLADRIRQHVNKSEGPV